MNPALSTYNSPDNACHAHKTSQFLSRTLLSACLLLSSQAWAATITGERYTSLDATWGFLGYDLDVDNNTAAVGAWLQDGAVHIYDRDPESSQWNSSAIVLPPIEAQGIEFGFNVWLNNNQLIVGAPNIFSTGHPEAELAGKAFVYERNTTTTDWVFQGMLSAGDEDSFSQFGREVIIDGNRAAVSVSPGNTRVGRDAIFVFDRDTTTNTWNQTAEIQLSEDEPNDVSVENLLMLNGQLIVAVSYVSSPSKVLVYDWLQDEGVWVESGNLTPDTNEYERGAHIGLSGDHNTLLVTDPSSSSYHLFERDPATGTWIYDTEFTSDITTVPTSLGKAAAFDNGRVVVADANNTGAYVYQHYETTGQWLEVAYLSLGAYTGNTITSVSMSGNNVWLGTPYLNGDEGSAYSYELSDESLDLDDDGVADSDDNCPLDYNPTQSNHDGDLLGDACDLDDDNDGVDDDQDAFPYDATRHEPDASSSIPSVPAPTFPSNNEMALETAFFWPVVPGSDYYVIEVQHEGTIRAYEPMISASGACTSGQCVYYKSDAVMMGDNRWRLRAGNDLGISAWSEWTDFVVSLPAGTGITGPGNGDDAFNRFPAMPVPVAPSGSGNMSGFKYQWQPVPGVIDYAIEIQHNGLIRAWEPQIPANLACVTGVCEFVMTDAALPGSNRWRLSARNDIGQTQWSEWTVFALSGSDVPVATAPAIPAAGSPQGNDVDIDSDYVWNALPEATHYAIEIQHDGEVRGYDNRISASTACVATTCRYAKPDASRFGTNQWRIGAYNDAGFSGWSQWQTFVIE